MTPFWLFTDTFLLTVRGHFPVPPVGRLFINFFGNTRRAVDFSGQPADGEPIGGPGS